MEYCVEPKFDGASISLIYENDLFPGAQPAVMEWKEKRSPRTSNRSGRFRCRQNFRAYGIQQIEIRGEVLMNKNNFKKYQ